MFVPDRRPFCKNCSKLWTMYFLFYWARWQLLFKLKVIESKFIGRRRCFPASVERACQYSFFKSIHETWATTGYKNMLHKIQYIEFTLFTRFLFEWVFNSLDRLGLVEIQVTSDNFHGSTDGSSAAFPAEWGPRTTFDIGSATTRLLRTWNPFSGSLSTSSTGLSRSHWPRASS